MAKDLPVSPLAPERFPDLPQVRGVRFATAATGSRYKGRDDVMLAVLAEGTTIAGTFTRSSTRAAPVLDCEAKINGPSVGEAAILVNAGNSNAFTGRNGEEAVARIVDTCAEATGIRRDRIFTASTGVIGEPLDHSKITAHLARLNTSLSEDGIEAAANAIRTTDTFAKGAVRTVEVEGKTVTLTGIAKGSGMIAPDMATMLVYIFTDARIARPDLQSLVSSLTNRTFNCITVDSDTSTSDTLLVAATGASGVNVGESLGFASALHDLMLDLAHQVVRDGEGATKFVEITVTSAHSDAEARQIGLAIANSPLVKTAIAGEDPNWGRIVMAIGKSGAHANRDRLTIRFGDILVAENGWVAPSYREEDGAAYMKAQDLHIAVDLGLGGGHATVWTCDLTHGYVTINADYRS